MNGQPPHGGAPHQGQRPTPQQLLQMLMQMDPEKRAETLNRNPQLRVFIQSMERQRVQKQANAPPPSQMMGVQPIHGPPGAHGGPTVSHGGAPGTARRVEPIREKRVLQVPPPVPVQAELQGNQMKAPSEWSRRMADQAKEPGLDVKLYEEMVTKDKTYMEWAMDAKSADFSAKLLARMAKDYNYYETVKLARMKSIGKPEMASSTARMWGEGYAGYGNGFTGNRLSLVYPQQSKMGDQRVPPPAPEGNIIPIRLEFDIDRDNFKLNDTLLWNTSDSEDVMVEIVNQLVTDFKITANPDMVKRKILQSFKDQVSEYSGIPGVDSSVPGCDDVRVPIVLNITIANNQLNDRFEWALSSTHEQKLDFADVMCDELALPMEFKNAIVHSITEQCQMFIKSLCRVGYKWDGSAIVSEDIKPHVRVGPLDTIFRPKSELGNYGANVQELNIDQFEKIIKERERELRRKKRTATRGRRGGFVLPALDDMPSTFRTPLPNGTIPGSVDVGVEMDAYVESLHSIEVPMKQQVDRARELERLQKANAHVLGDQDRVKKWLRQVVDRRMRGASLAAAVRVPSDGKVVIKFAWR